MFGQFNIITKPHAFNIYKVVTVESGMVQNRLKQNIICITTGLRNKRELWQKWNAPAKRATRAVASPAPRSRSNAPRATPRRARRRLLITFGSSLSINIFLA